MYLTFSFSIQPKQLFFYIDVVLDYFLLLNDILLNTKIVLIYCEKKIVLAIEKNFSNSRLKAENLQTFWGSLEQFIQTVKVQNNFL